MKKKLIFASALAGLVALGLVFWYTMRIETVVYTGNTRNEESALTEEIFGDHPNRISYYLFHSRHAQIPFVDSYDVKFTGQEADVSVIEKELIGYIPYMGQYLYFDKTGMVVTSSEQVVEGVPKIIGLSFNSIFVGQTLDVTDTAFFQKVLSFMQKFADYELTADSADFTDPQDIEVIMGDVTVKLGSMEHMQDKLYQLSCLSEYLNGRSGTLHLEKYDGSQTRIIFDGSTDDAADAGTNTESGTEAASESSDVSRGTITETTPAEAASAETTAAETETAPAETETAAGT